ncbi:low temperature requirement protein A [Jiangella asiatica]|uniref:Low temperature requirement protein A n=2 Tax=Jiangella asiatica TaxID=2530372 RepID=A0A4R5DCP8_9ACTN|nr:low temperature requirement protein A [Jiangella asiatica]
MRDDDTVIPAIRLIRPSGQEQRATFFELFFDLVYVFAITQLSHHLLAEHLSWQGAAETAFMLVAVYWAWNYTTWMANWFDPETAPVRLVLVFVMLASLLMSVAIPRGFGDLALLFGCSYAALQIGRNAFVVAVTPPGVFHQNFRQILAWSVLSAPLWVAGGLVDDARWPLWLVALGLDLAAPLVRYWLPGVGDTPMSQWSIDGHHFAERFQLFIIIALGESIVLTGATAAGTDLGAEVGLALGLSFLGSVALWWLYFTGASPVILHRMGHSTMTEVGALGRDIYTYLHLPIVGGIVLTAVGDELVVAHPDHEMEVVGAVAVLGGPALYLLGLMACGIRVGHRVGWPAVVALVAMVAAVPVMANASGVVTSAFVLLVLGALAVAEHRRARAAHSRAHVPSGSLSDPREHDHGNR